MNIVQEKNEHRSFENAGWRMAGVREKKREALRDALIEAAQGRIQMSGLGGLRARDIATDAGCALGSLYTVFRDIDDLILRVNSRTLARLGDALEQAATVAGSAEQSLVELASGYLSFAIKNKALWSALFDHRMPDGVEVPDWHLAEHDVLFEHIARPLSQLHPALTEQEISIKARTLFAAVHGIVAISLQDRFIAVPQNELDVQIRDFVTALVRGMASTAGLAENQP